MERMNREQEILVKRLKEAGLSTKRFLKVGKGGPAFENGEDKAAFESFDFTSGSFLYAPEEFHLWPRWGICSGGGLVLIDKDNRTMVERLNSVLPASLDVLSPRRKLPGSYYLVEGSEVPNKILKLPGSEDGAGEIRSQNQYLVAPGTEIRFLDLKTGEKKTGTYTILHDRPIAKVKFGDFMAAVAPYLGSDPTQKITHEKIRNGVPRGTRHDQGIKLANLYIGVHKLDNPTALQAMRKWNEKNQPPMQDGDLVRMVDNAERHIAGRTPPAEVKDDELAGRDIYSEAIDIFELTIKGDRRSIEFIWPAGISAYVGDPENLGLEAPTSEGKTYPTVEVLKHFPKEDVWFLGGLSPTALAHDKGVLIGRDNEPIGDKVRDLVKRKKKAKKEKDEDREEAIQNELVKLFANSKYLIDMKNKILVFLEAPQRDTFARLRPILSHDAHEITYKFTDKGGQGQLRTNTVVIRGWPAVIYLKAGKGKEDEIWPEIQSRFSTISPKMTSEKYREAVKLTAMKEGLPEGVFKRKLGLDTGTAKVEKWIRTIRERLLELVESARKATGEPAPNIFWIPFYNKIGEGFPAAIGRHMRDSKRFIKAMQMSAAINVFARPILKIDGAENIIVVLEDYQRAIRLFFEDGEELFSGIPGHVITFFKDVVLPEWDGRHANSEGQTSLEGVKEAPDGLTSDQLARAYKQVHEKSRRTLAGKTINLHYLRVLEDAGLMTKNPDPNNTKRHIWSVLRREIVPPDWLLKAQNGDEPMFSVDMLKDALNELNSIGSSKAQISINKVHLLEVKELYNQYFTIRIPDSREPIELLADKGSLAKQSPNNRLKLKKNHDEPIKREAV